MEFFYITIFDSQGAVFQMETNAYDSLEEAREAAGKLQKELSPGGSFTVRRLADVTSGMGLSL